MPQFCVFPSFANAKKTVWTPQTNRRVLKSVRRSLRDFTYGTSQYRDHRAR